MPASTRSPPVDWRSAHTHPRHPCPPSPFGTSLTQHSTVLRELHLLLARAVCAEVLVYAYVIDPLSDTCTCIHTASPATGTHCVYMCACGVYACGICVYVVCVWLCVCSCVPVIYICVCACGVCVLMRVLYIYITISVNIFMTCLLFY